jgi:hypothetical protein
MNIVIINALVAVVRMLNNIIAKLTTNMTDVEFEAIDVEFEPTAPVSGQLDFFAVLDEVIEVATSIEVVETEEVITEVDFDYSSIIMALGLATPAVEVEEVAVEVVETAVNYVAHNRNGKFVYIVSGLRAEVTANVPASWTWFSARVDIVEHYTNGGVLTGKMAVLAGGMCQDTFEQMIEWNQYSDAIDNRSTIKFI